MVEINISEQQGPEIKFRDISVYAPPKYVGFFNRCRGDSAFKSKKNVPILENINGTVYSNTVYGILGASGSGKTTLLNVISGYASQRLLVSGKIKVDRKLTDMTTICGFVQQTDLFYSDLTVLEHLVFQSFLRLGNRLSKKQITERCKNQLKKYGLDVCANTRIGLTVSQSGGISGGERRRLSIITEILDKPRVLFLDEVTSGLDSYTAETIVESLKEIAAGGVTIICTIHQPSSFLFGLLDNILVLARGRVTYEGPRNESIDHFTRLGYPLVEKFNPADHFIILVADMADDPGCEERIQHIINNAPHSERKSKEPKKRLQTKKNNWFIGTHNKLDIFSQMGIILWRDLLISWRQWYNFIIQAAENIFFTLYFSLTYQNQKYEIDTLIDVAGAIYFIAANFAINQCLAAVHIHTQHFAIFSREHRRNLYRTIPFYMAKFFSALPSSVILTLSVLNIFYWLIGLNPSLKAFFSAFGIWLMCSQVSIAFGMVISSISRDIKVAVTVTGSLIILLVLVGGYYIDDSFLGNAVFLRFISWTRYIYEATMILHYDKLIPCKNIVCILVNGGRPVDLKNIQQLIGLRMQYLYVDIGGLFGLFFVFHALAILFLLGKTYYFER